MQFNVNLSSLALPCSRILLTHGGVYCMPCSKWALGFLPNLASSSSSSSSGFLFFYFLFFILFMVSSREKISQWESDHQPLHLENDTSPLSPGSLRSSRTRFKIFCYTWL
jgi:hypothetical protein